MKPFRNGIYIIINELKSRNKYVDILFSQFIFVLPLDILLQRGEGLGSIRWFKPATFLRTWISNVICRGLLYVQSVVVIVRSLCFWWKCWPSQFKLSFHNYTTSTKHVLTILRENTCSVSLGQNRARINRTHNGGSK